MIQSQNNELRQDIPKGVEIYEGLHGLSIRSTRVFNEGFIIDANVSFCFLENKEASYYLHENGGEKSWLLHVMTNTLYYTETERYSSK
jgi:hypothetical protein